MKNAGRRSTLDPLAFLSGRGEMKERTRTFDWSRTPVGEVAAWPNELKTVVRVMLDSRYAMWLGWGSDFTFFYNDAYAKMTLGPKHPWALGRAAREVWPEIWSDIGPRAESVMKTGEATWDEGLLLFLERSGFPEETYHTFSYSPVPGDDGGVGGMLCVVTEDTERTIGERRLRTLRELSARTTDVSNSVEDACRTASLILAGNPRDLPFSLIYLLDADGRNVTLAGRSGGDAPLPALSTRTDSRGERGPWPFRQVAETGEAVVVDDGAARWGQLAVGPWSEPATRAVVLPMAKPGQAALAGFLVAGVSSRRPLDDAYRGFLDLVTRQIAGSVANAAAYQEEKRRAEALAELDRAKTSFFSNVSHEFRTPLTLMLGPIEDLLEGDRGALPPFAKEPLEVIRRNGLRLLRLVNTLLEFTRIEAGRVRATYWPVDLPAYTADLAGTFRSACERAGLSLIVDCPPLGEPVFVDPVLWEKVVLNLLSNAFKFTFEGEIEVSLRLRENQAELRVRDTGTGIAPDEMPRIFERFHRVENVRSRTHEGSGIGLALVHELVKLHGGAIAAESVVGEGTTFVVSIPLGSAHVPPDRIGNPRDLDSIGTGASLYVEEALGWLGVDERHEDGNGAEVADSSMSRLSPDGHAEAERRDDARPRVLVADDNADMRRYVVRLLKDLYRVDVVSDGREALAAALESPPDLVLCDVMMPGLNGLGLVRALRSEPRTRHVPIVLLSARAGEESRVEGMEHGADDYLAKPFSARELIARVTAHLQMGRARRQASETLRESEERLRLALTAGRMVSWHYDPATGSVGVSENAVDVLGLTPDFRLEHVEQGFSLIHPDDVARHRETIRKAVETCGTYSTRFRVVRPIDREVVWLEERAHALRDESGRTGRVVGIVTDVTERQLAEERFRAMADNIPQLAWMARPDGFVFWFNQRWYEYTGTTLEAMQGWGWQSVHDPAEVGRVVEKLRVHFESGEPWEDTFPIRRHDGEFRWHLSRMMPVRDEGGRVILWFGTNTDVTEQREADRRKDEFLATLAHELRNPLAPIRNGLHVMRLAANDPAAVERARGLMERQVLQMVRLVDDLLDVSRISRNKLELRRERIELGEVVRSAVETSRPLIKQMGHELVVALPPEPLYVDADLTRLAQVFLNLLNNSAKYTEPKGRIRLTAERRGNEIVASVKDTGIGIAADKLSQVFDLFMQVEEQSARSQGGLGIGLSLAKRLVELHGGSIGAASDGPGRGSTFTVRLPLCNEAPSPQGPADRQEDAATTLPLRVLVVDDNEDSADSLSIILRLVGYEVRVAYDGLDAVAAAAEFLPQVVLLDLGLPRLNGYDACRRIRSQPGGAEVVLIALTGWGQDKDIRQSREAGFDRHMVKPVDTDLLVKLLAESRAANG